MSIRGYIERQKERVALRHIANVALRERSAYDILAEIDALAGLNTKERLAARKVAHAASRNVSCTAL